MKFLLVTCSLFISLLSISQTIINRDKEIEQMIREVSADSLKSYIYHLVTFGTRNTLSSQSDNRKGIGEARKYVLGRFNEFASQSGGRMTALIDTTTIAADGKRIDK